MELITGQTRIETPSTSLARIGRVAANAAILGLWLWLYSPLFSYFSVIFSREDFRTNQWALVGVMALIAWQARQAHLRPQLDAAPHLSPPALVLAIGGSALYLLVERFLDINTLSSTLFGLASYGLIGLWLAPRRWRQGLPAALLLIGVLPFGDHLQTFVGYPMRLLTASIVRDGLTAAGIPSIGLDTILILENGVSQVDLPCSGVKSLWTGLLFLIAATWIERRPLNLRWLMTALVFGALLFIANVARVGVLVLVGQVLNARLAATLIHIPLGVLGFIAACGAAVVLLRRQPPIAQNHTGEPPAQTLKRPAWLAPVLAASILAMALAYTPRPQTGLAQPSHTWEFPGDLHAEPMPLKPDELEWLTRDGAASAERWRFEWRDLSGSMMLITSATWRAQHLPERCFQVYGLSLQESSTLLVNAEFPVRVVSLGDHRGNSLLSATYWFQSRTRTTDDYATRVWADLAPQRDQWMLVTLLFDHAIDPRAADVQAFYAALHEAVQRNLEGR